MKRRDKFEILKNENLADSVYEMVLKGDTSGLLPGMFVNIEIEPFYLRRPISVCDAKGGRLTIVYKEAGKGTKKLSRMCAESVLDIVLPLGNGFTIEKEQKKILLIGGGAGLPPLYFLCKQLKDSGKSVDVAMGFNTAGEIFYEENFKKTADSVLVMTADGSYGKKGFVTDAPYEGKSYDFFYACGPVPMLKAVCEKTQIKGELSLEARMGCGYGACMGCAVRTRHGMKRVCHEGPVFERGEIIWE